jgi:hypothetical protein
MVNEKLTGYSFFMQKKSEYGLCRNKVANEPAARWPLPGAAPLAGRVCGGILHHLVQFQISHKNQIILMIVALTTMNGLWYHPVR